MEAFAPEIVFQQLVNAVTLTAIYALIAVGVSLFFGAIGVVNLAHGDVAMLGAFAALAVQQFAGAPIGPLNPLVAGVIGLVAGIVAGGLGGWMLYRFAFRPLGNAPAVIGLLASIAAGFVFRESVFNFYPDGKNPQAFKSVIPTMVIEIKNVFILGKQLFVVGTAILMVIALATLIERTRLGRASRGVMNSREVSRMLGVPVERVVAHMFLLGGGLAGVAGVLNGTYYGLVQFDMGIFLTIKGFTAAVIGGLGNIYGALVGAVIVGMIEALTAGFVPQGSLYKEIVVFGVLIAILILMPSGIMGERGAEKV